MTETRTCENAACGKRFEVSNPRRRFCSDDCRFEAWDREHPRVQPEDRTTVKAHPLDEVRVQHEETKGQWTTIVRTHLDRTLLQTGYVSAEDFDALGIPDEHCNLANAQMGGYASAGYIEAVMFRRWSTEKKASRKSGKYWIYKLTQKGREKLAGLGADTGFRGARTSPRSPQPVPTGISAEPGEKQRGRDRQVRAAGCGEDGSAPATKTLAVRSDNPRRNTQPGRLSDSPDKGTAGVRSDDLLGGDGSNRTLAPVAADSGGPPTPPEQDRDPSACVAQTPPPAEGDAVQLFSLDEAREKPRSAITDPRAA